MRVTLSSLVPNQLYGIQFRYKSIDSVGAWSPILRLTVNGDVVAPPTPSTPTLVSKLGTVTVTWDGLSNLGGPMPSDFAFTEVHMGTAAGFAMSSATIVSKIVGKTAAVVSGQPISTLYFKFVAVDNNGNKSAAGPEASILVVRIQGPDLEANSVTTNELAAGSVTAAKIYGTAIDGMTINGVLITGSTFSTSATTSRVEIGQSGGYTTDQIRFWNSGSVSSIRNPDDAPGILRMSLGSGTKIDFSDNGVYGQVLIKAPGGMLKLLAASNGLQARDTSDSFYTPFQCSDLYSSTLNVGSSATVGSLTVNSSSSMQDISCGRITSPITYSSTTTGTVNALISTAGGIWRSTSSLRYKTDVKEELIPYESLLALKPKSWTDKGEYERNGNSDKGLRRYLGVIAEELAELPGADKLLVQYNLEGQPDAVDYDRIPIAFIPMIQELYHEVQELKAAAKAA